MFDIKYLHPFNIFDIKNTATLKSGSEVSQGQQTGANLWIPISVL